MGTVKQARYSDSTSKIHVASPGESDTMKVTPSEQKASVVVNKEALNHYFDKQLEVRSLSDFEFLFFFDCFLRCGKCVFLSGGRRVDEANRRSNEIFTGLGGEKGP